MPDTIIITRFENGRTYSKADECRAPVDLSERLTPLVGFIENCVVQFRQHGGPTGLSFCKWVGSSNKDENFREAHALVLDYDISVFEELRDAAERLGFARMWITTENKARSQNAISLVIPFNTPATKAQYERIASCIVKELDVYGLIDGALAVNHLINIHATSLTAYERGQFLDPESFIRRTKDMYQARDAKKYHGQRPAQFVPEEAPVISDGVFAWPVSA